MKLWKNSVIVAAFITVMAQLAVPLSVSGNDASYDVPLNEPVYGYLAMLPLPPRVGDISLSHRPFTEAQVCSLLVFAEKTGICSDTSIAHFYLRRYAHAAGGGAACTIPGKVRFDGDRTYFYPYVTTSNGVQDSNYTTNGFTTFGIDSISRKHEFYDKTGIGGRFYSSMGGFCAYVDAVILTEYSSLRKWIKTDDPHRGINIASIFGDTSHLMGSDDFTAYVKVPLQWCDFKIGNDRVSWGYADSSGMLFSGRGKPVLHMKFDKTIGTLNYTFLFGKLTADTYNEKRVFYAKHITYTPQRWLSLGFSDVIMSENRDVEAAYFLPFLPYYFSQHYIGSLSNLEMSFDGKLLLSNRWTAYGEIVMDDISNLLSPFRNTSWDDKWGGIFGIKVYNPLPAAHTSVFTAEIVQIEPWTYTETAASLPGYPNYPVNFGNLIGNALGPHSRELKFDLTCQFSKKLGGALTLQQIWKGHGPGSSVGDIMDSVLATTTDTAWVKSKAYRFKMFDRNRTVVSLSAFTFLNDWLQLDFSGDLMLERRPVPVNLFHAGIDVKINY